MGFIRISLKIEETLISWQTDVSNFRNINDLLMIFMIMKEYSFRKNVYNSTEEYAMADTKLT